MSVYFGESLEPNSVYANDLNVFKFDIDNAFTISSPLTTVTSNGVTIKELWRSIPEVKKVIINDPAVVCLWSDGTKTVAKCEPGDVFNPEFGLAVAITKKYLKLSGVRHPSDKFRVLLEKASVQDKKSKKSKES